MFRTFDPNKRRLITMIFLAVALFVAAVVVPVVVVANYFQNLSKTEEPISVIRGDPTQTQWASPSPTIIELTVPSQVQVAATPSRVNCTYTAGYWLNHQELWPALISVNEFNYTKEEAIRRLQAGIHLIPGTLFLELHAALLNVLTGAEAGGVMKIMDQSFQWLSAHPENRPLNELELQQALTLAEFLRDFNNGISGPGLCEGQTISGSLPDIATLFPTGTSLPVISTGTYTITPSQFANTQTLIATATKTKTASSTPPVYIPPSPTRTSRPPRPRNTQSPTATPVPTQPPTATPLPTQTPIPPTATKEPTPTSPPESWIIIQ